MEFTNGLMEGHMRENTEKTKRVDMESIDGSTEGGMRATGHLGNNMDWVST